MKEISDRDFSADGDERYRMLVDAVVDYAIYMLDPDGTVVSWNAGAERLKGYSAAEAIGLHFSSFYLPEDVSDGAPARALATAEHEGLFQSEGWRLRKDGTRFWAQVVVRPILTPDAGLVGFAKVTRDLSERKAAQDALQKSEEQFGMLVQAVTDYAIYMLDAEGFVSNWNAGARRAKGYEPHEVIGTHFSRFYRAEDRARGIPKKALATAAAEGRFEGEGWRVRKDGTEFWANVVIDPVYDKEGGVIGFAKVTRDITEKRNAQLALDQAREALFQSQKLDAIGQLTGGVAHDFNNLLMVVLTSLELLRRRVGDDDDKLTRLVENAASAARRGVSLTQRMLAFARRQELQPIAVDVPALLAGMRDMLERTLGPTIRIDESFEADLPPVRVDPHQLELALLNLAVNARDAMPDGGRLAVAAAIAPASDAGRAGQRAVRISLTDSGAGMNAATLARALEPFFTTKGVGKGTGLGLAMVHGLAVQSGGRFVLESVEGTGTVASLWLPVAVGDPAPASPAAASAPTLPGTTSVGSAEAPRSLRVVVVDDDPLVLSGTMAMLEELGHRVMPVASAQEALALVRVTPDVDLVLSDQVMPGMSGLQLLAALRRERPALPLILASGFAEIPGGAEPAVTRLSKPFDIQELARAIALAFAARG